MPNNLHHNPYPLPAKQLKINNMETTQEQPESAGTRLLDGLYKVGKGRTAVWIYVKDGIMWLPTAMMHPLIWISAGKPITIVEKRSFMRAKDIMEEMPSHRVDIETLAVKHGLAV